MRAPGDNEVDKSTICARRLKVSRNLRNDVPYVGRKRAITAAEVAPFMMNEVRTTSFITTRAVMRAAMAAFYLAAGIVHLLAPEAFLPIVPDWVPLPREIVLATGVCEIAGSIALMT